MRALPCLILAAVLGAAPAQAQELNRASQRLELLGDAPVGCIANSARASGLRNATFQDNGPSGGVVVFPQLVDGTTAMARESAIELAVPVVCNTSHTVTVRSYNGGLLRQGAQGTGRSSGGFSEFQAYQVGVQWQGQRVQVGGQSGSASIAWGQPAKGDLTVDITVPQGTAPLVAGTYTDAVVVEILPAS